MAHTNEIDDSEIRNPVPQTLGKLEALGDRARQAERVIRVRSSHAYTCSFVLYG